jgi:hypothetical protein
MRTDNELLRAAKDMHLLEVKRMLKWAAKLFRITGEYPSSISLMESAIALGGEK